MPLQFLRRNQKWILVVGGGFLMIAFLAPSGLSFFDGQQNPQNRVYGRVGDEVLRASNFNAATSDLRILDNMKRSYALQGQSIFKLLNPARGENDEERASHWLLMLIEAEKNGA